MAISRVFGCSKGGSEPDAVVYEVESISGGISSDIDSTSQTAESGSKRPLRHQETLAMAICARGKKGNNIISVQDSQVLILPNSDDSRWPGLYSRFVRYIVYTIYTIYPRILIRDSDFFQVSSKVTPPPN